MNIEIGSFYTPDRPSGFFLQPPPMAGLLGSYYRSMNFRDRFHTWSEFGLEYLIADILVQPENEQRHADYDIFLLLCHATDWLQNAEMLHFDNDSPVGEIEDLVFVMKSHWWKGLRNWLAHPLRERLPKVMLFRHPLASSISPQKWNLNYRNGSVTPVIWERWPRRFVLGTQQGAFEIRRDENLPGADR